MVESHIELMSTAVQDKNYKSNATISIKTGKPARCFNTFLHNDRSLNREGKPLHSVPIAVCFGCNKFWIRNNSIKKRADEHVCSDTKKHIEQLESMVKPIQSVDAKKLIKQLKELQEDYDDKDKTQQFEYLMFERLLWAINEEVSEETRKSIMDRLTYNEGDDAHSAPYSFPNWESKLGLDGSTPYPEFPKSYWADKSDSDSNGSFSSSDSE